MGTFFRRSSPSNFATVYLREDSEVTATEDQSTRMAAIPAFINWLYMAVSVIGFFAVYTGRIHGTAATGLVSGTLICGILLLRTPPGRLSR